MAEEKCPTCNQPMVLDSGMFYCDPCKLKAEPPIAMALKWSTEMDEMKKNGDWDNYGECECEGDCECENRETFIERLYADPEMQCDIDRDWETIYVFSDFSWFVVERD